jgi:hypothetical protein
MTPLPDEFSESLRHERCFPLPLRLLARPVRRAGHRRHRRRLRHRPLHRARTRRAGRARRAGRPQAGQAAARCRAEIVAGGKAAALPRLRHPHEDAVRTPSQAIVAAHGRIDGLVNNAGGQYITPLAAISAKGWEAVIHTNLTGGFLVARECYLQSMQAHGGAIVNIVADIWGSMPGMGHSGAARAGMVSFTETAALEWAEERRARERGGAGLHRIQRHGPLPARGRRHAARHAQDRARGPLRHRGRDLRRHRFPAEPRGQLHQRQRAARRRRAAAGAHGLADGAARCAGAAARGAALRRLSSRADAARVPGQRNRTTDRRQPTCSTRTNTSRSRRR